MSEKRFKLTTEEDICYCEYTYWKGDEPLGMEEVVDVLNEQQATIRRLQDLCGESDYENAKLRLKNKELQDKIDWLCEKYDYPKGVKNE